LNGSPELLHCLLFFRHALQDLDFRIPVIEDVQQSVFHQFMLDRRVLWEITDNQLVQMQETELMNQEITEELLEDARIARIEVCYNK
jgi:hypothetical protein